jgi:hypothetical protein
MLLFEFAIKCVVLLLCVYPIVDRICRCKEQKYVSDVVKKFTDDNKQ